MKESAARLSNEVAVNVAELEPSSSCCGLEHPFLSVCLSGLTPPKALCSAFFPSVPRPPCCLTACLGEHSTLSVSLVWKA